MGSYEGGNYSLGYVDDGDSESQNLKGLVDHFYQTSYPVNSAFWQQATIDKRFKAGDQTLWALLYGDSSYYQSRRFFFNLIRRHCNMITGFQRRNRKSTIAQPNQDNDALSDDYTTVLKWSEERDGFQEYFSQAFEGGTDVGLGLLHLYPNYTFDPISGDLFTDYVAYNNFLIDPYWRKLDFSDCNFIWRRRWVNKTSAKALLPGRQKEIDKLQPQGAKDGRFPLQAELLNMSTNHLFAYDEVHYRSTREATLVLDPYTGEAMEWEDEDGQGDDEMERVLAMQPWLITSKAQVPTVKLIILLNGKVFYHGPNLLNIDPYPFAPLVTYYDADMQSYPWRLQGVIRNLRDAQFLYNRRKVIELDILESQINSGWIYPVDVVTDPKAFRQQGQGFLIPLKAGRQASEVQRLEPPNIPASMMELSRSLAEDITKISGVNEELLGAATDDKAGVLAMLRQGAGLTTLQNIFDKADYAQRLYGKIRLQAIRKLFSKGKVTSILGREPNERFFSSSSIKFNIAVEEGNYSTTQRQTEFQQALYMRELGIPIANKTLIRKAFISDKEQVMQDMQEEQQAQQQAEQQQAEMAIKKDNADVMEKYTKAQVNMAKQQELLASADEKYSKIDENEATAEHKKTEADLNLVKMMMDLENQEIGNMQTAKTLADQMYNIVPAGQR